MPDMSPRYEDDLRFGPVETDVKLLAFYTSPDWLALRDGRLRCCARDELLRSGSDGGPRAELRLRRLGGRCAESGDGLLRAIDNGILRRCDIPRRCDHQLLCAVRRELLRRRDHELLCPGESERGRLGGHLLSAGLHDHVAFLGGERRSDHVLLQRRSNVRRAGSGVFQFVVQRGRGGKHGRAVVAE